MTGARASAIVVYTYFCVRLCVVCSFYYTGHYQSLYAWDGRQIRLSRIFHIHNLTDCPTRRTNGTHDHMKRHLLILLALLISLPSFARDFDYTYEGQTLTYTVIDESNQTCMTKKGKTDAAGNKIKGDLTIPSYAHDGKKFFKVISIGKRSFLGCNYMTSIKLPETLASIGQSAFFDCERLPEINLPNSLSIIEESAFCYCRSISHFRIPESVTVIGTAAFFGCSNLTSIQLPPTIMTIESQTFGSCCNLESISIPNSVTFIGEDAFHSCESLKSITIPESVTSIEGAFPWCKNLSAVNLPESITSIYPYTFCGCTSLESLRLPSHVSEIGKYAFAECHSLKSLTCLNPTPPICNEYAFEDMDKSICTLHVPFLSISMYMNTPEWCDFIRIDSDIYSTKKSPTDTKTTVTARFDLNGTPVDTDYKGIFIECLSDGSRKKRLYK